MSVVNRSVQGACVLFRRRRVRAGAGIEQQLQQWRSRDVSAGVEVAQDGHKRIAFGPDEQGSVRNKTGSYGWTGALDSPMCASKRVHVDAAFEQKPDRAEMAAPGGLVEGFSGHALLGVHVGAAVE